MTVPTRAEAALILCRLDPPQWLLRHSTGVADVAAFLARAIARRGTEIDVALVATGALLHDVGKLVGRDADAASEPFDHGRAGARWLAERGHAELGRAVEYHPATLLTDDARYAAWVAQASLEERVVSYADKRFAQDVVTLDERFAEWLARHPEATEALTTGRSRAALLEDEVCAVAGIDPAGVGREEWAVDAVEAAR